MLVAYTVLIKMRVYCRFIWWWWWSELAQKKKKAESKGYAVFKGVKGVSTKAEMMGESLAAPVYIVLSACMDCMF